MVLAACFAYVPLNLVAKNTLAVRPICHTPSSVPVRSSPTCPARFENEPGEQEAVGEDVRLIRQAADASGPRLP